MTVNTDAVYVLEGFELTWTGCVRFNGEEDEFLMVDAEGIHVAVPSSVLVGAEVKR